MNVFFSWIVKELAALRAEIASLHAHNGTQPAPAAEAPPAHAAPVATVDPPHASGLPAPAAAPAGGPVVFDPSAHPGPAERLDALHKLQAQHPLGTRIVDPQGNDVDVRGDSKVSQETSPGWVDRDALVGTAGGGESQCRNAFQPGVTRSISLDPKGKPFSLVFHDNDAGSVGEGLVSCKIFDAAGNLVADDPASLESVRSGGMRVVKPAAPGLYRADVKIDKGGSLDLAMQSAA